jgi:PAS domain S-box-containing protein
MFTSLQHSLIALIDVVPGAILSLTPEGSSDNSREEQESTARLPRRYVQVLVACAVLAVLVAALILHSEYREQMTYWQEKLTRIADVNQQLLESWLKERDGDAQELASFVSVKALVSRTATTEPGRLDSRKAHLQSVLDVFVKAAGYEAVYVLDRNGITRAQSGGSVPLPLAVNEACSTASNRKVVTILPRDGAAAYPRLAIQSAIFGEPPTGAAQQTAHPNLGCVVVLTQPHDIASLLLTDAGATVTGETVLAALDENQPVFISPLRNWSTTRPLPRVPPDSPAHIALVERRAVFGEYRDYRGVPVLVLTRFIPGVEWGMVTKVDRAEALSYFHETLIRGISITVLSMLVLVGVVSGSWRHQRIRHLQADLESRKRAEEQLRLHATAREAMEDQLRRSEERMRLAFDAAKIGFWDWDIVSGEHVWSATAKRQMGLADDSPANLEVLMNAVHPDDRRMMQEAIDRAVRDKIDYALEYRSLWPDGSLHWRLARGHAAYDSAGRAVRMTGIAIDIDDLKRAEEQLQLQAAVLQAAANSIVITDREGTILWTNYAFSQLTGYAFDEVLGKNTRVLKSGEQASAFYENLWRTITSGQTWHGEIVNKRKDGSLYPEEMTITPVRSGKGEISHFVAIKQDISERKRLEAQFLQAQKMEAVGRLAGGIAHDFNNALGVITGYSDILKTDLSLDDPKRAKLEEIHKAGQRAASLTRQLLAFSRKQPMQPVVLDLNSLVSETDKMLRPLIGEDIELILVRESKSARVKADRGQVEQILMNLAVNARDAMPEGGKLIIKIANADLDESYVRQHPYAKTGRYVMLCVSDSGSGMDQETQAHIFEPFFTTKGPGKGTGLGLSTVYGIVKQSGGHIVVYSEPGKGTTFRIYFPEVEEAVQPVSRANVASARPRGTETILLVEDEGSLRELARGCLQRGGYTVLEAREGRAAIEIASRHDQPIHLLLTDVIMPGLSGRDLADSLLGPRPDMKVLYMSGYTDDLIAHQGVLDPGTSLLEKPFSVESLLIKVREVLDATVKSGIAQ